MSAPLLPPHRLLARYREGSITFEEWQEGMQKQCDMALKEAEEDYESPKLALLESWRCKNAARKILRNNTDVAIREVLVALSSLDDFPPAIYLWNADNRQSPLHCFLRESRLPVIRFPKLTIRNVSASLEIEYSGTKHRKLTLEKIVLRRNEKGEMIIESRREL